MKEIIMVEGESFTLCIVKSAGASVVSYNCYQRDAELKYKEWPIVIICDPLGQS